jgi:hypothetical protein
VAIAKVFPNNIDDDDDDDDDDEDEDDDEDLIEPCPRQTASRWKRRCAGGTGDWGM